MNGVYFPRQFLWFNGPENAIHAAMRHLNDTEPCAARGETVMARLSGKTPAALRRVLTDWPLMSPPMAETQTGISRATGQRNLVWMDAHGLIRAMTGQGRFRAWRFNV